MYFANNEHKTNFLNLITDYDLDENEFDKFSASYVMSHPSLYTGIEISEDETPVEFAFNIARGMYDDGFLTGGSRHLMMLALNLWNDYEGFNVGKALGTWGDEYYLVFVQAMELFRGRHLPHL